MDRMHITTLETFYDLLEGSFLTNFLIHTLQVLTNASLASSTDQNVLAAVGGDSLQNVMMLLNVFNIDYNVFLQK